MPSNIKDILPRVEIRERDRRPGRYPTIARTGDSNRRGNNRVFFDDTVTVLYETNVSSSYPTTLPAGSRHVAYNLTSSIAVSNGNVTKASEQFITVPPQTESFRPFVESNLVNQDIKTNQFYLTGSGISDVGLGFTHNLGAKTMIKIPLEISTASVFPSQDGAVYYYNRVLRRFEARTVSAAATSNQNPAHDRPFGNAIGSTFNADSLFNALGVPQTDYYAQTVGAYSMTVWGSSPGSIFEWQGSSLLTNASNAATSSQYLDISSYIHAPFLLEKATLEIPFSSSAGWYDSVTGHIPLDGTVQAVQSQMNVGGPAVTFAILNQLNTTHREIICSGTIVPDRDCNPWFETNLHRNGTEFIYRTLNGFGAYSTPGFRVPSSNFNGRAKLFMNAAQSHGYIYELSNLFSGTTEGPSGGYVSVAPWGRGQNGVAGRSLFGGEFKMPEAGFNFATTLHPSWSLVPAHQFLSGDVYLYNVIKDKYSPYLVNPKDNLIAYLSISHPVMHNDDPVAPTAWVVSGNYDGAGIPAGTAYLTLFGSFIKEEEEFHDTLNQRLETDEIHEIIGNDPVLDQFDVVSNFELSGTITDRFSVESAVQYLTYGYVTKISSSNETQKIFSSFSSANDTQCWSTQYQWSSSSLIHTLKKSSKNTVLLGDETFWDTRIPDPSQIIRFYNTSSIAIAAGDTFLNESNGSAVSGKRILYTGTGSLYFSGQSQLSDWIMTCPFDPKFKNISTTFANTVRGDFFNVRSPGVSTTTYEFLYPDRVSIEYGSTNISTQRRVAGETDTPGGGTTIGLGLPEFIKFFYGFGDGHGTYDNCHVKFDNLEPLGTGLRTRAVLRGWRYGLLSGFPLQNRAVWRRDRFGQPRDMLEQRLDAKFYLVSNLQGEGEARTQGILTSPVQVKFVDSTGASTLPEYTYSSNLSLEATSSLPYFDGAVRNRENPISLAQTNLSNVVI